MIDSLEDSLLNQNLQYLSGALAIARIQRNNYSAKGAILVQEQRIRAIGYDDPKTGEIAELMALRQVGYTASNAVLYTSLAPKQLAFSPQTLSLLVNSQIRCLIYGYCELMNWLNEEYILKQIENSGIRLLYLRIPEVLSFYAPYRFFIDEKVNRQQH